MLFRAPLLLNLVSVYAHFSSCLDLDHDPLQVTFDDHVRVTAEQTPRIAIIGIIIPPRFCANVKGQEQEAHQQHTIWHD
jgi:hypothetical protein